MVYSTSDGGGGNSHVFVLLLKTTILSFPVPVRLPLAIEVLKENKILLHCGEASKKGQQLVYF